MATETPNYKLQKPDVDDFYDVAVLNDNWDKLDAAVAKVLEAVPELRGGAGTGSTGNFARRNGGAEDALDAKIRANIMGAC